MKLKKDKFVIKANFHYVENGICVNYSFKPRFDDKKNFLALVGSCPKLTKELFGTIEIGCRNLVDENYADKEAIRKILERVIEESAQEIEKIKNLVS